MSELPHIAFFERYYRALRKPYAPMRWMRRLFVRLVDGNAPKLVDLPTGAGKTELIVVWLIALAWYAQNRDDRSPIPRRMVWVVNRRVLVQQVFDVARDLADRIESASNNSADELPEFRHALRNLCRSSDGPALVLTQLRGQLVDDREWSFDPTIPQIIIGTVDQIGSRLLFQGYGQGKWSRPLHAALFGVDAWVCIDEAHLVPAFALTLRQTAALSEQPLLASAENDHLQALFARLPFWTTELSATPALPAPEPKRVLDRQPEDDEDDQVADRLLAAKTRRVIVQTLDDEKQLVPRIIEAALASIEHASAVAIFVQTVKAAVAIAEKLRTNKRVGSDRVVVVTGRLRGYERDRLRDRAAFKAFRRRESQEGRESGSCFLVGTAAAEVGLDADADAVLCDFASMPTLLQRLGRLDRRGVLSKAFVAKERVEPPTMTIFSVGAVDAASNADVTTLAAAIKSAGSVECCCALPWREATEDKKDKAGERVEALVHAATWSILAPQRQEIGFAQASAPAEWLGHKFAAVTVGPTVAPPLTSAILRQWTATTQASSRFLPVHPWLYGLLPSDAGTPLVGIAFRLELDALQIAPERSDIDESEVEESERTDRRLTDFLSRFPPLRAELHFVPIWKAAEWLSSDAARGVSFARFDGDQWTTSEGRIPLLRPDDVLVFGTTTPPSRVEMLLEGSDQLELATCDVFEAVSAGGVRYRREIIITNEPNSWRLVAPQHGVLQWTGMEPGIVTVVSSDAHTAAANADDWDVRPGNSWKTKIGREPVTFRYRTKKRPPATRQSLTDHQSLARASANALVTAVAPGNEFFIRVVTEAAAAHDEGKRYPPWQRAMGNDDITKPVAKPVIERPASTNGYRHEWGSLLRIAEQIAVLPSDWDEATRHLWHDLRLHLIGAHHGYLRPSLPDRALPRPPTLAKQMPLRLAAIERFARLQLTLGPWRLAYLEALLKAADVDASREPLEDTDED